MKRGGGGKIGRREFVGSAVAGALVAEASMKTFVAARAPRPNVLFILADDLGWGDLSCYGRPDYRTTNLDALAKEGTRFTQAYSASPVCTPTRCAFLTGQYPARHPVGLLEPLPWKKQEGGSTGLDPSFPTVASLLKNNGYETALIGKWHLGYLPKYGPLKSGFEEFYGVMSGAVDYFTHDDANGERDFFQNQEPVPAARIGYMTALLSARAVEFLERRRTRPFYLSLHYTAPHWPWEGPRDEELHKAPKRGYSQFRGGGSAKVYAEMMRSLDESVGRVLRALRESRLERDTLVIFTSDNGGEHFSYNWPFTGRKGELLEGGIRVPALIRWPGVVPAGLHAEQVAITMDWTATILAATETKPDPQHKLDGLNLLPAMRSNEPRALFERTLFWRHGQRSAVRSGNRKYWHDGGEEEHLFDLAADPSENADFQNIHPEEFEKLKTAFTDWDKQVLARVARPNN